MEKKNQPYHLKVGGIIVVLAIVAGLAAVFFLSLGIWLDKQFDSEPIFTIVAITAGFFSVLSININIARKNFIFQSHEPGKNERSK